jgi:hypothetical protein
MKRWKEYRFWVVIDGKKVAVASTEAKSIEQARKTLEPFYEGCGLVPIFGPDPTAGLIRTPEGVGKFVEFKNGKVTVEMDNMYLVEFDASECYLHEQSKEVIKCIG